MPLIERHGCAELAPGKRGDMQIGIAAYLRNLAVRCNKIARGCQDSRTNEALLAISAELADKAETLEETFKVAKN